MWNKVNPLALLVRVQAGAATLENNVEVPQEVKNRATLQPSNCTTRYLPQRYKCGDLKGHLLPMFIGAMSAIVQLWKEPRCPSTDEWIKKIWYKLPFAMMWMELEETALNKISQTVKGNYFMISLKCGI